MTVPSHPVTYSSAAPAALPPRHALGMPAGSIRAMLALTVLGLLWLIALHPSPGQKQSLIHEKLPLVFVYLQVLMVLILAHFFAAHGNSIGPHLGGKSPLGLPRGSVRLLLLAGYLGLAAFLFQKEPELDYPPQGDFVLLMLLLFSAFFLGHLMTSGVRRMNQGFLPPWFQDIEAWLAMLGMIGLGIILLIRVIINPSLPQQGQIEIPKIEAFLVALVGFYFGARS